MDTEWHPHIKVLKLQGQETQPASPSYFQLAILLRLTQVDTSLKTRPHRRADPISLGVVAGNVAVVLLFSAVDWALHLFIRPEKHKFFWADVYGWLWMTMDDYGWLWNKFIFWLQVQDEECSYGMFVCPPQSWTSWTLTQPSRQKSTKG